MDLVIVLKALVMGVIALLMLFILVLMVRAAAGGRARRRPAPSAAPRRCEKTREGKLCGNPLYRCSNCLEEGCQMTDCEGRCFKAPGNCLRCGFGSTMEPV